MNDQYLGTIQMVAFTFVPENFAFCNAALIPIQQNPGLFSLLGTFYGGDGRVTFGMPDFRARMPVGSNEMGIGPGLTTFPIGTKYGAQTHTMTEAQMPVHSHAAVFTPSGGGGTGITASLEVYTTNASADTPTTGDYISGGGGFPVFGQGGFGAQLVELGGLTVSGGGSGGGTVTVSDTGSGKPLDMVNPLQAVNFVICTQGLYPSRS